MKRAAAILAFLAGFAAATSPVRADAIDGDWCSDKGQNLSIHGPRIRIPSGAEIEGIYRRHQFAYDVPAGEDHAGETVYLELLDEEDMVFRRIRDGVASEPEYWKRCSPTS